MIKVFKRYKIAVIILIINLFLLIFKPEIGINSLAGTLIKKGSNLFNVLIFVGAWSATKIPISLFEASVMVWKFMITRYVIDIPVIILMAFITNKIISENEKKIIYDNAKAIA